MRDSIVFYLNGQRREARGEQVFLPVARYLREQEGVTGTKIVCEEGDCGACTVLVGRLQDEALRYRPINSCIQFLFQMDSTHIITVEGLSSGELSPIQKAMVQSHGAQCGYCTPGFVVAMTALADSGEPLDERSVRDGLTGNLCRCTGYEPIIRAALSTDRSKITPIAKLHESEAMIEELRTTSREPVKVAASGRTFFRPIDLVSATAFRSDHPDSVVVQGGRTSECCATSAASLPRRF